MTPQENNQSHLSGLCSAHQFGEDKSCKTCYQTNWKEIRMTNPPQDYIEEKCKEFDYKFVDWEDPSQITEHHYKQKTVDAIKDFIRTALREQKEMLEKEWREKIELLENRTRGNTEWEATYKRGFRNALLIIRKMLQNEK